MMKISVITTCFNSSEYIEKTIRAVLNQELDFKFEYIISDDGSTDDTVQVIKKLVNKHSKGDSIKLIAHEKNVGIVNNFFNAIFEAKGQFIAFCDSDDVWQDKMKLSKQYKYMFDNPNCVLTYHHIINKLDKTLNDVEINKLNNKLNTPLLSPQTSTLMIRNIVGDVPKNLLMKMTRMNDQLLRCILSSKGDFVGLKNILPTERVIRRNSVFGSPRQEIKRKRSSLYNWSLIYQAYQNTNKHIYLRSKVQGFESAVKWLEYKEHKDFSLLKLALGYDLKTGVFYRGLKTNIKRIFLKPLFILKQRITRK